MTAIFMQHVFLLKYIKNNPKENITIYIWQMFKESESHASIWE